MVVIKKACDFVPFGAEKEWMLELGILRVPFDTPFPVEPVNALLIKGEPNAIIDCGLSLPGNWERLERSCQELGFETKDIGEIYLTHPHLDHFGLAQKIVDCSGAKVFAWEFSAERFKAYPKNWFSEREVFLELLAVSGVEQAMLNKTRETPSSFKRIAQAVKITDPFAVETKKMIAGRLLADILHVPGHSPWCNAFWFKEQGILVGGDLILERITPNPIWYPSDLVPSDWQGLQVFQRSLRRIRELPVKQIIPGHGFSFQGLEKILDRAITRQVLRRDRLHTLLQGEAKTAFQCANELFGESVTKRSLFLVMSETLRHLDWLLEENKISQQTESPKTYQSNP